MIVYLRSIKAEATASHLTAHSRAGSILGLLRVALCRSFFIFVVNIFLAEVCSYQ